MHFLRWLGRLFKPPIFVVSLENAHATALKGNLSVEFLADCADLASKRGISEGRLMGVWKSGSVVLEFSPEIPEEHHQVFRNLWGLYRRRHKR